MESVKPQFVQETWFGVGDRVPLNVAKLAEFGYIQLIQDEASSILPDLIYEVNRVAVVSCWRKTKDDYNCYFSIKITSLGKAIFSSFRRLMFSFSTIQWTLQNGIGEVETKFLVLMDFNG